MEDKKITMERIEAYALTTFGKDFIHCNDKEKYIALVKALMEEIVPKWNSSLNKFHGEKKAYYLSAEFLMGRALSNNLVNMNIESQIKELLEEWNVDYNTIDRKSVV